MYFKKLSIAAALSLSFAGMGAAHADLVTNGSFISGLTGWTVTDASSGTNLKVDLLPGLDFGATASIDDTVSQSLTTIANHEYQISYDVIIGTDSGPTHFESEWGGSTTTVLENVTTAAATQTVAVESFDEVASSNSTLLTFAGYNQNGKNVLTGVSVTDLGVASNLNSIPEPEVFGMMIIGLSLISFAVRRKQDLTA
jgi:hypothetical protein